MVAVTSPESAVPAGTGRLAPALARAAALLEVGRAEQALAELARLPADAASSRAAFALRTHALVRLERWGEAETAARQGLSAVGPDPDLLGDLGLALHGLHRYAEAERALLDGLTVAPEDVDLICRYALVCLAVGQVDKAGKLLDAAAELNPYAPIVLATRVDLAFARGDDAAAERHSREFLAQYPDHPLALALHARSAALRGRMGPAYASMRQAVSSVPTDQDLAEVALHLKVYAHPLLAPVRPMYRLGVVKSWLLATALIVGLRALGWTLASVVVALLWAGYCVYSWITPVIVRRLVGVPLPAQREAGWVCVLRWTGATLALLVGLGCAGLGVVDWGPNWQAAHGGGTTGTLVLTRSDCVLDLCDWYGDFTGDDGSVRTDVAMQAEYVPEGAQVGDVLRVRDTGARDGLFPESGSDEWISVLLMTVVGVGLVVVGLLVGPVLSLLRRRPGPPVPSGGARP
jgi:tetratricopeptide (TPR) repeat protein